MISFHLRVRIRGAVAFLIKKVSGAGLLAETPFLDQRVRDRIGAVAFRVFLGAPLPGRVADVETGEIADGKRPHRIAEVVHHLVDLFRQRALFEQRHHFDLEGDTGAVGQEAVAVAADADHLVECAPELDRTRDGFGGGFSRPARPRAVS